MDYVEMWRMRKKQIIVSSVLSLVAAIMYMETYDDIQIATLIWTMGACLIGVIWNMIVKGNPLVNVLAKTMKDMLLGLLASIITPLAIIIVIPAAMVLSVGVGLLLFFIYVSILIYPISSIYYLIRYRFAIR